MNLIRLFLLFIVSIILSSCSTDKKFKERLETTLQENPELILKVIEKNPTKFLMTLDKAARTAKDEMQKNAEVKAQQELEEAFNNPLVPEITDKDTIHGPKDAPITIVEYSDFECPFCKRGYTTINELLKTYKGKVRFIYKHLPLSFHPQAMISAKYYEAIALQSPSKAMKFHDSVFENQSKLKNGEAFLTKIAKELKVDMIKLQKDIDSKQVTDKINQDMAEAKKFGMSGTPGFLINGIPVKGAYPAEYFTNIINKLKKMGKVQL